MEKGLSPIFWSFSATSFNNARVRKKKFGMVWCPHPLLWCQGVGKSSKWELSVMHELSMRTPMICIWHMLSTQYWYMTKLRCLRQGSIFILYNNNIVIELYAQATNQVTLIELAYYQTIFILCKYNLNYILYI